MQLRSINAYLIAKISDRNIHHAYERYIADMLYVLAQGKRIDNVDLAWGGFEDKMLGKTKPEKEENLSAQEIIARVKAAHSK